MKTLPQKYDTAATEKRWQEHWLEAGTYNWDESAPRDETFVIDTPPPTVSGHLHMGHVFSYTQADFVARWQRMNGKTVFYPMGFDDNGLPTERLVEKATKKRAVDFASREEFIEACMGVSDESRKAYRALFQSTALSVDWNQEYHTVSKDSRKMSQLSFLDLFQKGHVTRKLEPMLWDPIDQTAIAQAEVEDKELPSHFCDIYFGVEGSDEKLTIATTRPELIPACVGIFYHPEDTRYQHLKDKVAITPLFGVKVPILEDDSVEIDKGTGIMMCCTFGDEADIEKWRKHNLELKLILNKYGKIEFEGAPEWMANKKAKMAREEIIKQLDEAGVLVESKPITHAVKCAERSGAPLEILPTPQWFVSVMDKKEALKAKSAECNWHPEWMSKRMDQWIDGLSWDWCISRQRYFGVPFPIWYSNRASEEGKVLIASADQLPCNPLVDLPEGYSRDEVDADVDVMDTWATSSISPQLSSKAITPELAIDAERHSKLFPADLRPQAHEIIRTWAFYTVVKAHLHGDTIPWKNLMISGWCLAEDKTKMSKSKGNVVTPIALIEEHGSDVVRYWASTSKLGQDTAFSRDLLKIGKKLVNKLWNATKFAAIHLEKLEGEPGEVTETLDKWIISRLHHATEKATAEFEIYEYASALRAIEDFFWNDFCDNYLELVKKRAYDEAGENRDGQMSAVYTIHQCLDGILRLFAPIVPHVTEELWSHIFDAKAQAMGSIHARGNWPKASDYLLDEAAEVEGIAVVDLLEAVRKAKSEKGVSIKWPITQATISADLSDSAKADLAGAGNIALITQGEGDTKTESEQHSLSLEFAAESDAA
ncbi:MAG: valine--tRNA ligase [Rickettsiales bacterium]|nr:valine--tRNA ligase [Rickettsiales bacterium]